MSFKLLRFIINRLKRISKCPSCGGNFTDDGIFVLTTTATPETSNSLMFLVCPKCTAPAFVFTEVHPATSEIRQDFIRLDSKRSHAPISTNEVLDMHNFLKDWKGDVKELFQ